MNNIPKVVTNVEKWIKSIEVSENNEALYELALLFCDSIYMKEKILITNKKNNINEILESPDDLIHFNRDQILNFVQRLSNSDTKKWEASKSNRETWSQLLGGVTLSYASEYDLSVVAALIRAGAILNLKGEWLDQSINFLLDQQQTDGYFGSFYREIYHLDKNQEVDFLLRLTVDVLWAIAELTYPLEKTEITSN